MIETSRHHERSERHESKEWQLAADRLRVTLEELAQEVESHKEGELRPRSGLHVDADKIENQQCDILAEERGYSMYLKLSTGYREVIEKKMERLRKEELEGKAYSAEMPRVKEGYLTYRGTDASGELTEYRLSKAWEIVHNGVTIKISRGINENGMPVLSADGVVRIEIPAGETTQDIDIAATLDRVLIELLGINTGIAQPRILAIEMLKRERYLFHHKKEGAQEAFEQSRSRLVREDVFRGYSTFVERGKHKEYMANKPYGIYHRLGWNDSLPAIIKGGGLVSTHERMRHGLIYGGLSPIQDMREGGADSVFTRIATEESGGHVDGDDWFLVLDPDMLDRIDWYANEGDNYGTTDPDALSRRIEPKEIVNHGHSKVNEVVFPAGVSVSKFKALVCASEVQRDIALALLREQNISEVNGQPIETFVVVASAMSDMVDIAQGKPPSSQVNRNFENVTE